MSITDVRVVGFGDVLEGNEDERAASFGNAIQIGSNEYLTAAHVFLRPINLISMIGGVPLQFGSYGDMICNPLSHPRCCSRLWSGLFPAQAAAEKCR
jgi:hypothetical protein